MGGAPISGFLGCIWSIGAPISGGFGFSLYVSPFPPHTPPIPFLKPFPYKPARVPFGWGRGVMRGGEGFLGVYFCKGVLARFYLGGAVVWWFGNQNA